MRHRNRIVLFALLGIGVAGYAISSFAEDAPDAGRRPPVSHARIMGRLMQAVDDLRNLSESMLDEVGALRKEVGEVRNRMDRSKQDKKVAAIGTRVDQLTKRVDAMEARLDVLGKRLVDEVRSLRDALRSDVRLKHYSGLGEEIGAARKQVDRMNRKVDALDDKVGELQKHLIIIPRKSGPPWYGPSDEKP